jgi:outer membrane protein assembly factor BamD (BamD/ComL family)
MRNKLMPPTVRLFAMTAFLSLAVSLVSCGRKPVQPVVPPPAVVPSPVAPNPALLTYEAAEESFAKGDYTSAVKSYEAYLLTGTPEHQDRTFFRLGLAYGFAPERPQNLRQARNHLQRLVSQFPGSPYRAPADLILLLLIQIEKLNGRVAEQQSRITTLTEELQVLKAIDMKRSPSRPSP